MRRPSGALRRARLGAAFDRPMEAVRELRRCVSELGFAGLRMLPWLWEVPPTDRRFYPLYAACVELGVPFCTQVGHTGPAAPVRAGAADPLHRPDRDRLPGARDRVRPRRLPVDRGDDRRRPQARERVHRHLGVHEPAPAAGADRLHAHAWRRAEGPVRQQLPDDRPVRRARGHRSGWGWTRRAASCTWAPMRAACSGSPRRPRG